MNIFGVSYAFFLCELRAFYFWWLKVLLPIFFEYVPLSSPSNLPIHYSRKIVIKPSMIYLTHQNGHSVNEFSSTISHVISYAIFILSCNVNVISQTFLRCQLLASYLPKEIKKRKENGKSSNVTACMYPKKASLWYHRLYNLWQSLNVLSHAIFHGTQKNDLSCDVSGSTVGLISTKGN